MFKIPRKKLFVRLSFASVFLMAAISLATILTIKNNDLDTSAATGNNSSITIKHGTYINYGDGGHTEKYNIDNSDGQNITVYCAQPSLDPWISTATAKYADSITNANILKLAIVLDQYKSVTALDSARNYVYQGSSMSENSAYAWTHAIIGAIYDGDYRGVTGSNRTWVDTAITRLQELVNSNSDAWLIAQNFRLYGSYNGEYQDILWVESNQEYGKINVQKCDIDAPNDVCKNDDRDLSGIEFTVYNSSNKKIFNVKTGELYADGDEIAKATSDAEGRASFADLPVGGIYTVKETKSNGTYILTDEAQTVSIENANETKNVTFRNRALRLNTIATDYKDGDHFVEASETATIVDKVEYCVKEGVEYTVKGVMMDKASRSQLIINGKKVEKTATINPTKPCGSIDMLFELDASDIAGKDLVTFEYLYAGDELIETHEDFTDASQTVTIISLATIAEDNATGKKTLPLDENVEIKDHIVYCLKPGLEYTIKGTLMDKETKEAVLVDSLPIERTLSFTPEEPCGELDMFYTVNTTDLAGKKLVFFEDLYYGEDLILEHHDYNDYDESLDVMVPPPDTGAFTKSANSNGSINGITIVAVIAPIISLGVYAGMRRNSRKKFFQK